MRCIYVYKCILSPKLMSYCYLTYNPQRIYVNNDQIKYAGIEQNIKYVGRYTSRAEHIRLLTYLIVKRGCVITTPSHHPVIVISAIHNSGYRSRFANMSKRTCRCMLNRSRIRFLPTDGTLPIMLVCIVYYALTSILQGAVCSNLFTRLLHGIAIAMEISF